MRNHTQDRRQQKSFATAATQKETDTDPHTYLCKRLLQRIDAEIATVQVGSGGCRNIPLKWRQGGGGEEERRRGGGGHEARRGGERRREENRGKAEEGRRGEEREE